MTIVTSGNFEKEVLESSIPVVIDFFADWCMPCKMFAPIFEETAETFAGKVKFVKVNIDASPELAQRYRVLSIPTLKLVKGGEVIGEAVGAMGQELFEDWLNEGI